MASTICSIYESEEQEEHNQKRDLEKQKDFPPIANLKADFETLADTGGKRIVLFMLILLFYSRPSMYLFILILGSCLSLCGLTDEHALQILFLSASLELHDLINFPNIQLHLDDGGKA